MEASDWWAVPRWWQEHDTSHQHQNLLHQAGIHCWLMSLPVLAVIVWIVRVTGLVVWLKVPQRISIFQRRDFYSQQSVWSSWRHCRMQRVRNCLNKCLVVTSKSFPLHCFLSISKRKCWRDLIFLNFRRTSSKPSCVYWRRMVTTFALSTFAIVQRRLWMMPNSSQYWKHVNHNLMCSTWMWVGARDWEKSRHWMACLCPSRGRAVFCI